MAKKMESKTLAGGKRVMTPPFRVSFPSLFAPSAFEGQEPKYSVVALFPKGTDLTDLKKLAKRTAKEKWPVKSKRPKKINLPFRDGNEKADELDGYEDVTFCRFSSKRKPGVVDRDLTPITNEEDLYPGCWARATINAFAYNVGGNAGVSFGLQNIQKIKDDESFYGGANPEDDFDELDEDEEEEDEEEEDEDEEDEDDDF